MRCSLRGLRKHESGELRGKRVKIPCGPAAVSEEPKPVPYIEAATEKKQDLRKLICSILIKCEVQTVLANAFCKCILIFGKAGRGSDTRAGRPAFHIL